MTGTMASLFMNIAVLQLSGFLTTMMVVWVGMLFAAVLWFTWWKPRRLESFFRRQGMAGTCFRFPVGDVMEQWKSMIDAKSKGLALSHDILPRVSPWFQHKNQKHDNPIYPLNVGSCSFDNLISLEGRVAGKIYFSWTGPYAQVVIADSHLMKQVLSDKSGGIQRSTQNPMLKLVFSGLSSYDGKKWAKHRKIINPAFHIEKIKLMAPAFVICCTELIGRWEEMAASKGSWELDVWPELQTFSGDVISRTAFGSSFEEGRRIFQLQMEQASNFIQNIWGAVIPGYSYLPTKKNLRMKAVDGEVKNILRNIIENRKEESKLGNPTKNDLLGLLLESSRSYAENGSEREEGMTTEDVVEECRLFYFAGQETTANLLTWTMVVLSMHQTWQERAREEALRVFSREKPRIEDLGQMKVATMVLLEVLRLYPPVLFTSRRVEKTTKLGNFFLPGGINLFLLIASMQHDPEIWGEDVHEFKPERFSDGVSKAVSSEAGYFPFGWGPQNCMGKNFTMVEAKFFLAMLLRKFRFELSPSYVHAPQAVITLKPQHGVQIILHKL